MKRINLTDGSTWFDAEKATLYPGKEQFDGEDFIDINTGDQWRHEALHLTTSGKWILHEWTQRERGYDRYTMIAEELAYSWLALNEHESAIPPDEDEARNVDAVGGETPRRSVRIPDALWEKAQSNGNASKLIVDLLTEHFAK